MTTMTTTSDRAWTGLLVGVTLLLYAVVAPSTILGGDNAEFATLGATGGVAHPSGYPLYVLYLRAFAWLPLEPAHAAALATALLGALQIGLLFAACRAWGARAGAAAISVAIYAGGPLPLLLHTHAEVFALNGVIVAAILWLAAEEGPRRGLARTATLGLLAGLGLANHMTCVLVAPLGLLGAVRGARESGRWAAAVALGVGGLALGLAPYLYLLVAPGHADGALSWGTIDSAGALLDHALRRDYGTFSLGEGREPVAAADQLAALGASIGRGWWYAPLAAAAWGLWRGLARPREAGAGRASWLALAGVIVLAGPAFALAGNVPVTGLALTIVERFHHLPVMLLVVPVAFGLDALGAAIERRRVVPAAGVVALAITTLVVGAAASWPHVRIAEGPQVELFLRNTLRTLPEDAVLIGSGDHQGFGYAYLQLARDVRPDVFYLDVEMIAHRWYRARVDARLGYPAIPDGPGPASLRLVKQLLDHGRTVFLDSPAQPGSPQARIVAAAPSYPWGTVIRVLPPGSKLPAIDALEAENVALLDQLTPRGERPAVGEGWAAFVYRRYAAPWETLAIAYREAGRDEDAARCEAIAAQLSPR